MTWWITDTSIGQRLKRPRTGQLLQTQLLLLYLYWAAIEVR